MTASFITALVAARILARKYGWASSCEPRRSGALPVWVFGRRPGGRFYLASLELRPPSHLTSNDITHSTLFLVVIIHHQTRVNYSRYPAEQGQNETEKKASEPPGHQHC